MVLQLMIDLLEYEKRVWHKGFTHIAGIDEVGRGPLAGPVYACAVIFHPAYFNHEVNDSKKIPVKKREQLAPVLCDHALSWSVGQASAAEIDAMNIRQATFLAMRRALQGLQLPADFALIDGEKIPDLPLPSLALIKGDNLSFTIAAASIIAKVMRDELMVQLHCSYPEYGFERNKGYGTAEHIQALHRYGPSQEHRRTFISKICS